MINPNKLAKSKNLLVIIYLLSISLSFVVSNCPEKSELIQSVEIPYKLGNIINCLNLSAYKSIIIFVSSFDKDGIAKFHIQH